MQVFDLYASCLLWFGQSFFDTWFLRYWKMFFEPKTKINYPMELVYRDRT